MPIPQKPLSGRSVGPTSGVRSRLFPVRVASTDADFSGLKVTSPSQLPFALVLAHLIDPCAASPRGSTPACPGKQGQAREGQSREMRLQVSQSPAVPTLYSCSTGSKYSQQRQRACMAEDTSHLCLWCCVQGMDRRAGSGRKDPRGQYQVGGPRPRRRRHPLQVGRPLPPLQEDAGEVHDAHQGELMKSNTSCHQADRSGHDEYQYSYICRHPPLPPEP